MKSTLASTIAPSPPLPSGPTKKKEACKALFRGELRQKLKRGASKSRTSGRMSQKLRLAFYWIATDTCRTENTQGVLCHITSRYLTLATLRTHTVSAASTPVPPYVTCREPKTLSDSNNTLCRRLQRTHQGGGGTMLGQPRSTLSHSHHLSLYTLPANEPYLGSALRMAMKAKAKPALRRSTNCHKKTFQTRTRRRQHHDKVTVTVRRTKLT